MIVAKCFTLECLLSPNLLSSHASRMFVNKCLNRISETKQNSKIVELKYFLFPFSYAGLIQCFNYIKNFVFYLVQVRGCTKSKNSVSLTFFCFKASFAMQSRNFHQLLKLVQILIDKSFSSKSFRSFLSDKTRCHRNKHNSS